MADRYDERYRDDQRRGERGYGSKDRGFTERVGDEVRSWFGDDEAERRRRIDEQERRERERSREYGPRHEQEWGDYPYRGETWDRESESGWRGGAGAGRAYGEADYGRSEYGRYAGETRTEPSRHPYGGAYGFGWETGRRGDFTGIGPKDYQRPDARIHEDVCDRLTEAPDVDASDIEVKATGGEVTLSGSVRDREQKRRAEDLVERISGVREVHNNLRVSRRQEETTRLTSGT
jgi:osmotically-inducible protein OsmY